MKGTTKLALGVGGLAAGLFALARGRRRRPVSGTLALVGERMLVGDAGPPPRPPIGARAGEEDGLVVLRPGETRYVSCAGRPCGHVLVVLPVGEYEAYQRNLGCKHAGVAALVDVDDRKLETVVTWMVVKGGHLELAARPWPDGLELVAHVVASPPQHRFARF